MSIHKRYPMNESKPGSTASFFDLGGNLNPSVGTTAITALQGADLLSGLWYVNIHTATFPGGEIRGQITRNAVPVPLTLVLICSGLLGIGYQRRMRIAAG